jgi:hypothetical protein
MACQSCQRRGNEAPECENSGVCVCLKHEAVIHAGLQGVPWQFIDPPLAEFAQTVRNALAISKEALGWFEIETPYDTKTTQNLVLEIISDFFRK